MKRVLFTSCSSIQQEDWDHILDIFGDAAFFVCLNEESIPPPCRQRINSSNILSTEQPFYTIFPGVSSHVLNIEPDYQYSLFSKQLKRTLLSNLAEAEAFSLWTNGIAYWTKLLTDLRIDHICFTQFPHTGGDFILSNAAESLRLPAITFVCYSLDELAVVKKGYWHSTHLLTHDLPLPIKEFAGVGKSAFRSFYTSPSPRTSFQTLFQMCSGESTPHMAAYLRALDYSSLYNHGQSSVTYIGHLEIEGKLNPLGYPLLTNIHAVKQLRQLIPPSTSIYFRDHPHIFSSSRILTTPLASSVKKTYLEAFRTDDFFLELLSIPNTHYLNPSVEMPTVIGSTEALSSVTGTCALETFLFNHPYLPLSSIHRHIFDSYKGGSSLHERLLHLSRYLWPQVLHPRVHHNSLSPLARQDLRNNLFSRLIGEPT